MRLRDLIRPPHPQEDPVPQTETTSPWTPAEPDESTSRIAQGDEPAEMYAPVPDPGPAHVQPHPETCTGCGRPMPTDQELINLYLEAVGDQIRTVVPEMYRRLFIAAPDLMPLFDDHAPGLIRYEEPEGPGGPRTWSIDAEHALVGQLFGAVVALATTYDPDDEAGLDTLDSHLARYGRSHTRFSPPARIEEYAAVVGVVLGVLADLAPDQWTERMEYAWRKRMEYASGKMLAAQATARLSGRGRRRRTA